MPLRRYKVYWHRLWRLPLCIFTSEHCVCLLLVNDEDAHIIGATFNNLYSGLNVTAVKIWEFVLSDLSELSFGDSANFGLITSGATF